MEKRTREKLNILEGRELAMNREEVTFKGKKDGLLIIIRDDLEFPVIIERLEEKLKNSGNFFAGASIQIDIGEKKLAEKEIAEIKSLVKSFGLILDKIIDDKERMNEKKEESTVDFWNKNLETQTMGNSLLLKKTLRSGQRIKYEGNIIILGDVNPGAEIIAGGDIIVLGKLRGVAHAGSCGNQNSIVMAFRLQPIQLRIAQYITRSPDNEEISLIPTGPEVAKVKEGLVVIEPY